MVHLIRFNVSKTRVNPSKKYLFLVMSLLKVMAVSMSLFEMLSYHPTSILIVHHKIKWKILQLFFVLRALLEFRRVCNWLRTTFGFQCHSYRCEYDCGDRNYRFINLDISKKNNIRPIEGNNDCSLSITPWTHIFGCFSICRSGISGVQIVSLLKFDEEVYLKCIEVSRVDKKTLLEG